MSWNKGLKTGFKNLFGGMRQKGSKYPNAQQAYADAMVTHRGIKPWETLQGLQGQSQKLDMARRSGKPGTSAWSRLEKRSPSQKRIDRNRPVYGPGLKPSARVGNFDAQYPERFGMMAKYPDTTMSNRMTSISPRGQKERFEVDWDVLTGKKEGQMATEIGRVADTYKRNRRRGSLQGEPGYIDEVFGFGKKGY